MVEHTIEEAYLTQELNFKFQILPLTKQLTIIAGNLWIKSLQNSRAERNEMLLIHEFNKKGYIWPDKYSSSLEKISTRNLHEFDEENDMGAGKKEDNKGNKKKKKYAGGLVLEPKSDLYEHIVLLLDFNSLYPSIIQEFNLCFTTVKRKPLRLEQLFCEQLNLEPKKANKPKDKKKVIHYLILSKNKAKPKQLPKTSL